jgi:hypothetical protein
MDYSAKSVRENGKPMDHAKPALLEVMMPGAVAPLPAQVPLAQVAEKIAYSNITGVHSANFIVLERTHANSNRHSRWTRGPCLPLDLRGAHADPAVARPYVTPPLLRRGPPPSIECFMSHARVGNRRLVPKFAPNIFYFHTLVGSWYWPPPASLAGSTTMPAHAWRSRIAWHAPCAISVCHNSD